MLTLRIHNTGGTEESAEYEYNVFINSREIASGHVSGHNRNDGWAVLVRAIAEQHIPLTGCRAACNQSGECIAPKCDPDCEYFTKRANANR